MRQQATAAFFISPQQRLLCLAQDRHGAVFVAAAAVLIEGQLEAERLRQSLRAAVGRHEILRTVFRRQAGMKVPFQVVLEPGPTDYAQTELSWNVRDVSSTNRSSDIPVIVDQLLGDAPAFNLERGPVLRAVLAGLSESVSVLLLTTPAICSDPRSLLNLISEVAAEYGGGAPAEESLRYVQFAQWQNDVLDSEDDSAAGGREFWSKRQVSELPPEPPLEQHPGLCAFQPARLAFSVSREWLNRMDGICARFDIGRSTFLLACWAGLLSRITGRTSFPVSVTFDGREFEELQNTFGPVARALPIGCDLQGDLRFDELLRQMQSSVSDTGSWQEYFVPAEETRDRVAFEYHTVPSTQTAGTISVTPMYLDSPLAPFKLRLSCLGSAALRCNLHFDGACFSSDTIRRLAEEFEVLLRGAVADPEAPISRLPLLTENARRPMLFDWNATEVPYPSVCIHQLFMAQAERTPSRPAVVSGDESLTYDELDRRSNQLAHHLRRLGVGRDVLVGLSVDRSVHMITALLAVLKAGGAYVPLTPGTPKPRLARQLERATVVITQNQFLKDLPAFSGPVLCLDSAGPWADEPAAGPESDPSPDSLAYVLYTSGSTGTPKGVAVRHRNLVNYTCFIHRLLDLDSVPGGLQFATVSTLAADLGNTCIFPSLISGGTLHVLSYETATDSRKMAGYQAQHPLDVLKIVPSHLAALLNSPESAKVLPRRWLILGGETLSRSLVEKILSQSPACQIVNHYGPTETTVGSLTLKLEDYDWRTSPAASIPIGCPIANTKVYILDPHREPVPIGVTGELWIAGAGVSAGYLDQPEQTAGRFVPDPFAPPREEREAPVMYRTGDLARYLPDGKVEFLGRGDDQIKLRGFRIELGEIEAAFSAHPAVRQAVVLVREQETGDRQLAAWVVISRENQPRAEDLRLFLKEQLPDYMLPASIVLLDKLPLTANGKIDRNALPSPEEASARKVYSPPQTATEEAVARIWNKILGGHALGIDDNFFELGGHSLMATQIVSRVREDLSVELALRAIFENPTIRSFSSAVDMAKQDGRPTETIIPLSRDAWRRAPAGKT